MNQQTSNVKHTHEDSAIGVQVLAAAGAAPAVDFTCKTRARAVLIITAGDLVIDTPSNKQVVVPLPAGHHKILIDKVYASGSTAQGVTLLY